MCTASVLSAPCVTQACRVCHCRQLPPISRCIATRPAKQVSVYSEWVSAASECLAAANQGQLLVIRYGHNTPASSITGCVENEPDAGKSCLTNTLPAAARHRPTPSWAPMSSRESGRESGRESRRESGSSCQPCIASAAQQRLVSPVTAPLSPIYQAS